MNSIRRGLAITTIERQFTLVLQLIATIVVSRLLTPAEIGVWGVAFAFTSLLLGAREFATETFLIQRHALNREETQAAFTVMLFLSLLISCIIFLLTPWLARFYREPGLASVLHVVAVAVVLEVVATPLVALMRRKMEFGYVAIVNVTRSIILTAVTIGLAALGFSYMSFAWSALAAAFLSSALAFYLQPDAWVYKLRLRDWRDMLRFGGYSGINVLLYKVYETVPAFMLGRTVSLDAVGVYNRASLVCQLPSNVLLGAIGSVLLPALSAEAREGRDLTNSYLRAVSMLTALQWPALIVLAILAHGLVPIVLGGQWTQAVPLIQVMAIAALPTFTIELAFPVLVAVGAMRDVMFRALIVWPLSAVLIAVASLFGLTAIAMAFLVVFPLQAAVSLYFTRRHLAFRLLEFGKSCWRSAFITATSATGPLAVSAWLGFDAPVPIAALVIAIVLAALGWFAGVLYTRHEFLDEIARIRNFHR